MENLAEILKHRGKSYLLKDLVPTLQLTKLELKIYDARCTGLSFVQMEEGDLKVSIDQIMLRVASICGCALPNTEFFAKFIADEILVFILDFGYPELTLEEFLLAFRLNAKGGLKYPNGIDFEQIPFFGNSLNVDYISKVLSNYLSLRKILDRKLQNKIDGYEL